MRRAAHGYREPGKYTSTDFTDLLAEHRLVQSLSRLRQSMLGQGVGFRAGFATLKLELIDRPVVGHARAGPPAVFEFIAVFHNRQRLHSSLGYLSPAAFAATRASTISVAA